MAKTYFDESQKNKLVEPMFSRDRQKYRGNRSSLRDNLEINSLLVDLNRLNNQCKQIGIELDNISNDLIYNINSLTEVDMKNDGKDFAVENVSSMIDDRSGLYGDTEKAMTLETMTKLVGKIQRIKNKLIRLENEI